MHGALDGLSGGARLSRAEDGASRAADGAREADEAGAIVAEPMGAETGLDLELMEALFFAYRDFISSADRELEGLGFGRAHHRVLHFVNRDPGLTVAQLLEPLAITKQSLARTLKQLVDAGLIAQRAGADDRRQRRLYPTGKGRALTVSLAAPQSRRIAGAISALSLGEPNVESGEARALALRFLAGMRDGAAPEEKPTMPDLDPTPRTGPARGKPAP